MYEKVNRYDGYRVRDILKRRYTTFMGIHALNVASVVDAVRSPWTDRILENLPALKAFQWFKNGEKVGVRRASVHAFGIDAMIAATFEPVSISFRQLSGKTYRFGGESDQSIRISVLFTILKRILNSLLKVSKIW